MEECLKQLLILIKDEKERLDKKLVSEDDAKHREYICMFKNSLDAFERTIADFTLLTIVFSVMDKHHGENNED